MITNDYTTTLAELKLHQERLNHLREKKDVIYQRFCGLHSVATDKEVSFSSSNDSKVIAYLNEIETKKQANGLSIAEEIAQLEEDIARCEKTLEIMEQTLKGLSSSVMRLYYYRVIRGYGARKSVAKVVEDTGKSESSIWQKDYPIVKKEMEKLKWK